MRALTRTMTRRIVAASGAGLVSGFLVLAIAAPAVAQEHDTEALRSWLLSEANIVADLAGPGMKAGDAAVLDPLARRIAADARVRVTLIDRSGVVLGESDDDRLTMENHATRPEVVAAYAGGMGEVTRHSATLGVDLLYVAVPIRDGAAVIGVARTALPVSTLQSFAGRLGALILGAGIAALLVSLAVLVALARRVTAPIERLTASAERLAQGDAVTFSVGGPEEVERLGASLRRMAAAILGERQLAEAERDRLAVIIDELADAVVIADAAGRVVIANRAAAARFGGRDPVGHRLTDLIRDHEILDVIDAARLDVDEVAEVERSDPMRFDRAIARRLPDGQLLLVLQDLTTVRRLETVRRDFVANVSHELRTPLASLKAMAETLEGGAIDDRPAALDFVRRMRAEIDDLSRLVEELLTLGRLEAGEASVRAEPVLASELLHRARDRMAPLAGRAGIDLVAEPAEGLPPVQADRDRIDQVFANLIHNATKHTPAGGVIRLSAARADGRVAFRVADSGEGIAPHDLERIFERFYKADPSRTTGGTGLGLAIAKHIVRAHGGDITAESGPAGGAVFTFTIPVAEGSAR